MKDRHIHILSIINTQNKASVYELASHLNVSVETIRRDLSLLAKQRLLHRTHGGAISNKSNDIGHSFQSRQKIQVEQKKKIAERVIEYMFEGIVIGLDASSSSWYVAQSIPNIPCTVVTNSMHNISALVNKPLIKTIATGGVYSAKYDAFYGPLSEHLLSRLHIDICIFSCVGIDHNGVIWESNELNSSIKRKMMDASTQRFLLADSTKIGEKNLIKIGDLSEVDILFSDGQLSIELLKYCDQHQISLSLF